MKKKILLFILKNTDYFSVDVDDFSKIINALAKISPFEVEVIDTEEHPELAEKYKIDALPTLIIGNRRYVGKPDAKRAIEIFCRGK